MASAIAVAATKRGFILTESIGWKASHEVSGFDCSPAASSLPLGGELDRSAGWDLVIGGDVAGEAFSVASELSNPARALYAF